MTAITFLASHDWGHDGPPWPAFIIVPFLIVAIVSLVLSRRRCGPQRSGTAVLAERYARGEIDAAEYRERRAELRTRRSRTSPPAR